MNEAEGTELTERQRYWLEHVQACEASGKNIAEYAAEHGLAAQAMYADKKILVRKGVLPPTRPVRFQRAQFVGRLSVASGAFIYRTACRWHFPARWMRRH